MRTLLRPRRAYSQSSSFWAWVPVVTHTLVQALMKGCVRLLFQNLGRGAWKEFERGKATL